MKKPVKPRRVKPGLVKKPAAHHAPKKVTPKIRAARHAAAVKAARTRAANLRKHPHRRRQLALGSAVACCVAEALAASLRLSGWPVSDADVVALYKLTADGPDTGASIWETLQAAAESGLAGARPVKVQLLAPELIPEAGRCKFPLILGVDLPAPHAVLDTGSEWVTWGECWPAWAFPDVVIEEAWSVTWPEVTT